MLYLNYAGLSPTRPEVVRVMQQVGDSFSDLLFSESGISWYRKQAEHCSGQVAELLSVPLQRTENCLLLCPNSTSAYQIIHSRDRRRTGSWTCSGDHKRIRPGLPFFLGPQVVRGRWAPLPYW